MTFGVAAFAPFPHWPIPGWPDVNARGIVFAADTRYSFRDDKGRTRRSPFDFGMKVARLGAHAGCVCAGDVECTKLAIAEMRAFFRSNPRPSASGGEVTEHLYQRCLVADHKAGQLGIRNPFSIVVGYIAQSGRPMLSAIGPDEQLDDQPDWGMMIGQRPHQARYVQDVEERVKNRMSFTSRVDDWALEYVVPLKTLIDARADASIGGFLQVALVDAELGFQEREIWSTPRPLADGFEWKNETPPVTFEWQRGAP